MSTPISLLVSLFMQRRASQNRYNVISVKVVEPRLRSFAHHFGRRPLGQLNQRAVERWLESLAHLAPNSRAAYLSSLRQFTAWLAEEGHVPVDPCLRIPKVRRTHAVPRAQSREAVGKVLAACRTDRDRAIVWLMVGMGLRRGEVAALRWEDYDPSGRVMLVRGKGDRERELPVPTEVARILTRLNGGAGAIIRSHKDRFRGVQPGTIGKRVTQLMRDAGIKRAAYDGVSAHALRHTAASDVLDACDDLRVVQEMLGHQNLATTAIYLRRAGVKKMRAAMEGRDYGASFVHTSTSSPLRVSGRSE